MELTLSNYFTLQNKNNFTMQREYFRSIEFYSKQLVSLFCHICYFDVCLNHAFPVDSQRHIESHFRPGVCISLFRFEHSFYAIQEQLDIGVSKIKAHFFVSIFNTKFRKYLLRLFNAVSSISPPDF